MTNYDAEEIWKDVPGYEGRYQASSAGQIKALPRRRKNGAFRDGGLLKQQSWPLGYKKVTLSNDIYVHKTFFVHRIIAMTFIENPDNLPFVNHKDENPSNNCVDNLEWCTRVYNANYGHRLEKVRGENNKNHILTEVQVKEIREKYIKNSRKFGQPALAKKYGVSRGSIEKIVNNKKWKHLVKENEQ